MTIFVTGASGHLGGNVVRSLLDAGQKVRVLLREGSDNAAVDGLEVERAFGDLGSEDQLANAIDGCDRVVHLAALVSLRDMDREPLHEVNVLGTRRVMAAARRVGVRRVVHCSSFGAVGVRSQGPSDESCVLEPSRTSLPYERTKVLAEAEVQGAADDGLDVSIVNPSGMVGPNDFKPSLIGKAILDFARGRMPVYVAGGYDFVPVEDVAAGTILALLDGARGRRYLLTGEFMELSDVLEHLAGLLDRRPPLFGLPAGLLVPFVGIKDRLESRLLPRRHPSFNRHSIDLLRQGKRGDNSRARRELGWEPGSVRAAFTRHVDWFRAQDRL